jgi:hypothetical protein
MGQMHDPMILRKELFQFGNTSIVRACGIVLTCMALADLNAHAQNAPGIPRPDHVVIVVEENRGLVGVIGASDAPYINSLAAHGALFTEYYAIAHPSQPNYLALFSGSTQGVSDDSCPHTFATPNLGKGLLDAGLTFAGYSESLPGVGSTSCESGSYARKHVPWVNFVNVPARSNLPFSQFPSDFNELPTVSFVIPNEDNDMHSGSTQAGDNWLRNHLDTYVQWAQTNNSLLIVTFDEGGPLNQVATIFVGPMVQPGTYCQRVTHYHLLRTLEDMFGLSYAGHSANVPPIANVWRTGAVPPDVAVTSPPDGTTFTAGTNVLLAAEASSAVSAIAKVEFFSGATKLGEATAAPYTIVWSNLPPGTLCVSAKATDEQGNVSASTSIALTSIGTAANPFTAVKGVYSGLFIASVETGFTNSGWFTFHVTANGSFAGRFLLEGAKYPLRGRFDNSGAARVIVNRPGQNPITIELSVDLFSDTHRVSGIVSDGTWSATLDGERAARRTVVPSGKYALSLPAPGGSSIASINVSRSGQLRISATLNDTTRIDQFGRLSEENRFPLYAPLTGGRGAVFGWVEFDTTAAEFRVDALW